MAMPSGKPESKSTSAAKAAVQKLQDLSAKELTQRMVELEDFLHQVGPQGFAGLGPVPWAAGPEVADHGNRASKR